jgi:hypothetical protein
MNTKISKSILLIILIGIITNGCVLFRNPLKAYQKSENKVESLNTQLQENTNNIVKSAGTYVYATKLALDSNTNNTPSTKIAKEMNEKSIAILGTPSIEDVDKLKVMINNLLSTNAAIVLKGQKELSDMDNKVIDLQEKNKELQEKLGNAEIKVKKVFEDNSNLAQKWSNLMKWVWYVIYGFLFVTVLRIIAAACPPPYNSVVQVLAIPFTLVIHGIKAIVPEAISSAGWVSKEYKTATGDLVEAIQQIKKSNPELHSTISSLVAANTSDSAAHIINSTKADKGIVS